MMAASSCLDVHHNDYLINTGTDITFVDSELLLLSYNMHGYNQGQILVSDLICSLSPDIIMLQEHWLTPHNLTKFEKDFPGYYAFGSSALAEVIEIGPLVGRPFGGTMTLIKNELMPVCECISASERFVVVRVGDLLCINVYLPCVGTTDRETVYTEVLDDLLYWRRLYSHCAVL